MVKTIAEIGINHNGSIDIVMKLIDVAKVAGFDFVKFQKRTPGLCVPENMKDIRRDTPWGNISYLEYRNKIEFGEDEFTIINQYCKKRDVKWFSSAYDIPSAEFLKQFCTMIKIPSAKITDIDFIQYCRDNFDFVVMSTGMSTEDEIKSAVNICNPDVIMHCCAAYPAKCEDLNLKYIEWLRSIYWNREIGYSGHEYGLPPTFCAVALGVTWIERHITLDHEMWGSDQRASVDPVGAIKLIRTIRDIEKSLNGFGSRVLYECEKTKREQLRK